MPVLRATPKLLECAARVNDGPAHEWPAPDRASLRTAVATAVESKLLLLSDDAFALLLAAMRTDPEASKEGLFWVQKLLVLTSASEASSDGAGEVTSSSSSSSSSSASSSASSSTHGGADEPDERLRRLRARGEQYAYNRLVEDLQRREKEELAKKSMRTMTQQFTISLNIIASLLSAGALGFVAGRFVFGSETYEKPILVGVVFGVVMLFVDVFFILNKLIKSEGVQQSPDALARLPGGPRRRPVVHPVVPVPEVLVRASGGREGVQEEDEEVKEERGQGGSTGSGGERTSAAESVDAVESSTLRRRRM